MDQPSSTETNAIILRIKFKSASLDEFISRYGVDVSPGGIFIRTKQPVEVGTSLQFDFTLADGTPLLTGLGTVAWVRESDPSRANNVPGMGLRFDKLVPESQHKHQVILAEKARIEGKVLSTPYPPTSFISPASKPSPSPDDLRTAAEMAAKTGQGSANPAVTHPSPTAAAKPSPLLVPTPAGGVGADNDEFDSAAKTEISAKPLDFYLKDAVRDAEVAQYGVRKTAEDAVPTSLIEDFITGPEGAPLTESGPPPAGFDVQASSTDAAVAQTAPAKPLSGERKSGSREVFESLLGLGESPASSPVDDAAPAEMLEEISAGAPIEDTLSEKTDEVSLPPIVAPPSFAAPEPFDLGGASLAGDRSPSHGRALSLKPKGSGKLIAGIAVLAAAAAFGAVYLAKTKPWQGAPPESVPAVTTPAPAPTPVAEPTPPPAPAPAKAAVAEETVGKQPVAEEAKPTVAEKTEPEKPMAEKATAEKPSAEKPATEKPAAEKAMVAKVEPESSASKSSGKSGSKAGGKAGEEKAGTDEEKDAYRLVFRSTPLGAEVLIDGEYFARTPCERRVLDHKKSFAITIRREGYEPHERLLGPSDNWVKKGNERVLNVTVNLKKASAPAIGGGTSVTPPANTPEPPKFEAKTAATSAEPTKPAAAKVEPANPEAAKPTAAKPEPAKPEAAKPAAPAEKSTESKPVPSLNEPGKAKE